MDIEGLSLHQTKLPRRNIRLRIASPITVFYLIEMHTGTEEYSTTNSLSDNGILLDRDCMPVLKNIRLRIVSPTMVFYLIEIACRY